MAKKQVRKHIPENSIIIICKFKSKKERNAFLNSEEYSIIYGKLDILAIQKGAKVEHFTNP